MNLPAIKYDIEWVGRGQIFVYDNQRGIRWPDTCVKVWDLNASGGITETSERVRLKLVDYPTFTVGTNVFNPKTRQWEQRS